jgi:hypothetical protein
LGASSRSSRSSDYQLSSAKKKDKKKGRGKGRKKKSKNRKGREMMRGNTER